MRDGLILALLTLAAALVFHAVFPRYDWRVAEDGITVIVIDRWEGRSQRATFAPDGSVKPSTVYVPF
ncbi:MAG: hypothetical protein HYX76_07495 [Acidobacteria bacterium]|nr:hypothetical protein [Acidobacteriota bacterium]